jgi:hypothetical protein
MSAAWLARCVEVAAANPEFVVNWARIRGVSLPTTPMDWLVSDASGHCDSIAALFIEDVREMIYDRVPEPKAAA